MEVSTKELSRAIQSLKEAIDLYDNCSTEEIVLKKALRDACIQRFEFCIEFAWKTSMRILGLNIKATKPAVREMARNDLIKNPEKWLLFVDARNDTSHTYDDEVAQRVFDLIREFYLEVLLLMKNLEKIR